MLTREYLYYREFWSWFIPKFGVKQYAFRWLQRTYFPAITIPTFNSMYNRSREGQLGRNRPRDWTWEWPQPPYPGHPQIQEIPPMPSRDACVPADASPALESPEPEPEITIEEAFVLMKPLFPDRKQPFLDWREWANEAAKAADRMADSEPSQQRARVDLSSATGPIGLAALSDIHFGSPQCDYQTFARHVKLLDEIPNLFGIVLGDIAEWSISPKMMDATLSQVFGPAYQARFVRSLMKDLANKLLAIVLGNHEGRAEKFAGFDVGEYMYDAFMQNGAPYLKDGGTLNIQVGSVLYHALLMHGDRVPGNSMYSKTAKHDRTQRMQLGWHDFAFMGHTHDMEIKVTEVPADNGGERRVVAELQAGSYKVKHHEQYPHRMGFGLTTKVNMPAVILWPNERRIMAFHTLEDCADVLRAFNNTAPEVA